MGFTFWLTLYVSILYRFRNIIFRNLKGHVPLNASPSGVIYRVCMGCSSVSICIPKCIVPNFHHCASKFKKGHVTLTTHLSGVICHLWACWDLLWSTCLPIWSLCVYRLRSEFHPDSIGLGEIAGIGGIYWGLRAVPLASLGAELLVRGHAGEAGRSPPLPRSWKLFAA